MAIQQFCSGEPIELIPHRTLQQENMMKSLGDYLGSRVRAPATPYGGMVSAPYDDSMLKSMQMMMGIINQPYMPFNFPTMAPPQHWFGYEGKDTDYDDEGKKKKPKDPWIPIDRPPRKRTNMSNNYKPKGSL